MGSFLGDIEGREITIDRELLNSSYSKLVQFYSSYKSICEGYTISVPEYTNIFGPNQLSFEVWDTRRKGKIDATEMFTGLIIFSSISFQQKMKFQFEVFDFNEEGFLYYQNIALMLVNVCNATYKVYSVKKTASNQQIEQFLDEYFTQESQISFQKFLRWTHRIPIIGNYFRTIGHQIEQSTEEKDIAVLKSEECQELVNNAKKIYYSKREVQIDHKFMKQIQPFFERQDKEGKKTCEKINLEVDWIFGINTRRENIKYICSKGLKAANQRIIYSSGKVIIIYFPKLNVQHYYKEHSQAISVIQISQDHRLVASGEEGEYPQIHIWQLKNKNSLVKFKKLHKQRISFIKFFKNDQQLITTSNNCTLYGQQQTPIIILNLPTQEIIMSTYLQLPILGIAVRQVHNKYTGLIAVCSSEIAFFSQQKDAYQIDSEQNKTKDAIVAFAVSSKGCFLTGHAGRKLWRWGQNWTCQQINYQTSSQNQITQMLFLGQSQLCILDKQDIEVVLLDQNLNISRSYQLQIKQTAMFNSSLLHMEPVSDKSLLLLSQFGDVIKISEIDHFQNPIFHKYFQIFKLFSPEDYCQDSKGRLLIVSGPLLYAIDKHQKELCYLIHFDSQLQAISCCQDNVVLLGRVDDNTKMLYSVHALDYKVKETHRVANCASACLTLAGTYLLFFSENIMNIFHKVQDRYFQKKAISYSLQFSHPVSVVPALEPSVYLLFNELQQIWRVNLSGINQADFRKIDKPMFNLFERISSLYSSKQHDFPFCGCEKQKIFAVADNNGIIHIWENISQSLDQQNSALRLNLHCGKLSKMILKEDGMVSLGIEDGMGIIMKHRSYVEDTQNQPFAEQDSIIEEQISSNLVGEFNVGQNTLTETFNQPNSSHKYEELGGTFLKESEVEISPIQQSEQSQLKYLIKEILNPRDKHSYESQIRQQKQISEAKVNLEIQGINGLSSSIPHSVFYRHVYSQQPVQLIPYPQNQQEVNMQKQSQVHEDDFKFTKNLLKPLDQSHLGCTKQFLYAADRLCLLRDGKQNKQKVYDFHRRRVSCLAIHPDRQLVASCQESSKTPIIHIWDTDQMATKAIIPTRHCNIVTRVSFSRDGEWIVTLGGPDGKHSIQITSWRDEEELVFRLVQGQVLRQIDFNPYDRREVSVVGSQIIKVFKNEGGLLVLTDQCKIPHNISAMTYTSSIYGSSVQSDLITGSTTGSIGIFICGQFIVSKQEAHESSILCLRLAQLFGYKRVLISGGQDGIVKIWDIKFRELSCKKIKEELYSFNINSDQKPHCGITSLDVYQCLKSQGANKPPTLLLMGCSDGSVLQATIHNEFQGYQTRTLMSNQVQQLKQKINFDLSLLFAAPPNIPKTKFVIFKSTMITFNSQCKFIQLWNMLTWQRSLVYALPQFPSCMCFMNNSPFLVICYKNTSIDYFSLLQVQFQNTTLKGISTLAQIPLLKGHGQPIETTFSPKDNRIALLFANHDYTSSSIHIFNREDHEENRFIFKGKIQSSSSLVCFMEFNSNGQVLLVGQVQTKKIGSLLVDPQYMLKCYQCETQEEVQELNKFDFRRLDFSKKIKASYAQCSYLVKTEQQLLTKLSNKITAMAQYDMYLLLGTANGQLLVVQSCFFMKKGHGSKSLVRNYVICDSPILCLQVRDDLLFVASEAGQGIIKVKLSLEQAWGFKQVPKSIYGDNTQAQSLQARLKHVYSKRRKMQTQQEIASVQQSSISLKLAAVIGRSAFKQRNNIFVDLKDSIISYSGCNILIMKRNPGQKIGQLVVKPDPTSHSIHPQISAMVLGDCKRLLVVGTAQEQCKLLVWNISTNTYLFQIPLPGFVSVSIIKLSLSTRHAAVVAMTPKATKSLLFIDLHHRQIIGVFRLISHEININDICFASSDQYRILGCGTNYMGEWVYKNGILNAKRYSLGNSQDLSDIKSSGIVFYSLIFVENMAISSGSDGYLYVWQEGKLAKRQNAHPGHQVLSLYAATNSKIFASGGTNGRVVIWKVWSSLIIQHQGEYPKQGKLKFPIQSISMTRQSLVVGDTSGSIVQFGFGGEEYGCQTLLAPFDHQSINSCAFSTSSKRLYVLTDAQTWGTFAIFDTHSFQKVREQKIQFKSALIRMLVCRLSNRIFFVSKTYISGHMLQSEGKEEKGKFLKNKWFMKCQAGIKTAALSSRQNYLAVLVAQSSLHNSKIQIYNLQAVEGQFYALYKIEENIPASIDLIDFCIDHDYLLYQGPDQEQTIIDLMSKEKVKAIAIESQLEWNEQAKKTTPAVADIAAIFSEENKLLRLVQVMNKCWVATDEIGSVRVFSQPLSSKNGASQICIEHLNEVYICVVSPDSKLLVTVSRQDRAMHFWEFVQK